MGTVQINHTSQAQAIIIRDSADKPDITGTGHNYGDSADKPDITDTGHTGAVQINQTSQTQGQCYLIHHPSQTQAVIAGTVLNMANTNTPNEYSAK